MMHLADYRLRHASYRADRDLQALHAAFPMIVMWDDHESANDSWRDGAENHDPATEGDWSIRKRAAAQAFREWLPVSDRDWAEYPIGDLATIFRPETRLVGRMRQLDLGAAVKGAADPIAALKSFRDNQWLDPARTLMGSEQEAWLFDGLRRSARAARWQVFAQQVNMGFERMPEEAAGWLPSGAPEILRQGVQLGEAAAKLGMPYNMDSWNGYPAARSRVLKAALDADANLVVLSGDSHNAWAYDLAEAGTRAGVEFGAQSVTSPGHEAYFPTTSPADIVAALRRSSPELRWADTARRGYMTVEITRDAVAAEWLFVDTIRERSTRIADVHQARVAHGARVLA